LSSEALCRSRPRPGDIPDAPSPAASAPPSLAPGLEISRIVTGLWQVADMERDGRPLDLDAAAGAMLSYRDAGVRQLRHGRPLCSAEEHRRPLSSP